MEPKPLISSPGPFDSAPAANTNPESFDYLANGETLTLTYTLTLSDGESGTTPDTHNIVITINGTNDDPQITGVVTTASLTETDAALSASGTLTVADIDKSNLVNTSHSLVVSSNNNSALTTDVDGNVVPADPNGSTHAQLLAMLSLDGNPLLDATEQSDTLNWSFNSNVTDLNHNQAFDYLEFGENLVLTYTITVEDTDGRTATENVVITINGSNETPQITAGADTASLTESDSTLSTSGDFSVSDVDTANTVSATVSEVQLTGSFIASGTTLPTSLSDNSHQALIDMLDLTIADGSSGTDTTTDHIIQSLDADLASPSTVNWAFIRRFR